MAKRSLNSRDPPRVTCHHREYDQVVVAEGNLMPIDNMAHRFIFFSPLQISALPHTLSIHLRHCSSFELIAAYVWCLRTIALQLSPEEEVRFLCPMNLRSKINSLPIGYYGNAFVFSAELITAAKLCGNPLGYAVELIRKTKTKMTNDYVKSVVDLMIIKERPHYNEAGSFIISDITRIGFEEVDFGWGKTIFGGLTIGGLGTTPGTISFCIPFMNKNGEKGIMEPLCLRQSFMPCRMWNIWLMKLIAISKGSFHLLCNKNKMITSDMHGPKNIYLG
ncbi:benzyl alcohol O-benzoyltransferase-like [Cucurbita moschata]|uniref:Benzyl alcohol O-benzoyltransferase-like n=1 Tax=Cucurbita moschata TaxID=3662 RepID=A0A6J1FUP5_CUCMO|nr:benzyl alcohol O-benzoyltransferase-like [Cucurbita moschata]